MEYEVVVEDVNRSDGGGYGDCIRYCLVHELIHVRQVKQHRITNEILEEIIRIPYREREIEIEAYEESAEIIRSLGSFEAAIVDIIESSEPFDNPRAGQIETLYQEFKIDNKKRKIITNKIIRD